MEKTVTVTEGTNIAATVSPDQSTIIVDLQGKVLGIVFATSASDPNQAYALTDDEINSDLNDVRGRHTIDTSKYQCAA